MFTARAITFQVSLCQERVCRSGTFIVAVVAIIRALLILPLWVSGLVVPPVVSINRIVTMTVVERKPGIDTLLHVVTSIEVTEAIVMVFRPTKEMVRHHVEVDNIA